jgi:hypothetical protein
MNELTPDDRIEALVRRHLEQQAEAVDAADVLWQVRRRQFAQRRRFSARRLLVRVGGVAAAAAVIMIGLLWIDRPRTGLNPIIPAAANERELDLLNDARQEAAKTVDRCYRLQAELPDGLVKRFPALGTVAGRESKLWTRGDRFAIETTAGERHWAWSRDAKKNVWVAFRDGTAVVFTPDEVADLELVALFSSFYSMELDTLLGEIPTKFDLAFVEGAPEGQRRIVGTPKPDAEHPTVARLAIDIDPTSKAIQRIELHRQVNGESIGKVTLTLIETAPADDARYSLEARIPPGGQVLDPSKAGFAARRLQFISRVVRKADDPMRP